MQYFISKSMKEFICLFILTCFTITSREQGFINGDFEHNSAVVDKINISNQYFNSHMAKCRGFGSIGNLDIITSSTYGGGPQSGKWYVALTGGGSDLLSIELLHNLVPGIVIQSHFMIKLITFLYHN